MSNSSASKPGNTEGAGADALLESDDTMERIRVATFRVVARDTISGTRMPAIAREARVSQGALHYFYGSKEKLLLALLEWLLDAFREAHGLMSGRTVPRPTSGDLASGRRRQLEFLRLLVTEEREMTRVYYDFWVQAAVGVGALSDAMKAQFATYRDELKATMLPRDMSPVELELYAALVVGMLEGPVLQLMIDRDVFELEAYLDLCDRVIASMLDDRSPKIANKPRAATPSRTGPRRKSRGA